jgi:hypothetical protein
VCARDQGEAKVKRGMVLVGSKGRFITVEEGLQGDEVRA